MAFPDLGDDGKTVGGIIAAIVATVFGFRKWLSSDRVERAGESATVNTIGRLQSLLEDERKARSEADQRADRFAAERNHLVEELGALRGQILALASKVESLEAVISSLRGVSA